MSSQIQIGDTLGSLTYYIQEFIISVERVVESFLSTIGHRLIPRCRGALCQKNVVEKSLLWLERSRGGRRPDLIGQMV